jgi:cytochrome c553
MRRGGVALLAAAAATLLGCSKNEQAIPTREASAPADLGASASVASAPGPSRAATPASTPASGPIIAPTALVRPSDAQRSAGATLASQGGGNAVVACASCHGPQGEGNAAAGFPRLAGQSYLYLLHELASYADDTRKHPVMAPIAKAMSPEQRQAGAAYYASLAPQAALAPAAAGGASAPAAAGALNRGRQLARVGDDGRLLQACANCHGPDGHGESASIPYLAAQHASYLASALAAWRDGSRNNDPTGQMPLIAKGLSDPDVQAVAAYYAQQPAPPVARDQDRAQLVASSASAVVSGPRAASGAQGAQGTQGVGSEQGAPLTGGGQGPGGGGGGSGSGSTGSATGNAAPATDGAKTR